MRFRNKLLLLCTAGIFCAGTLSAQVPAPEAAENMENVTEAGEGVVLSRTLEVPFISIYYVQPDVLTADDVKITFYVSDWHQSEVRLQDKSKRFNAFLSITDKQNRVRKFNLKDIPAGDHTFPVGKLPEGDYTLRLYARDVQGRYSPSIYHEFRVRKTYEIPADKIYKMIAADLKKYGICNTGDYGVFHYVDATGKDEPATKAIVEAAAAKLTAPDGKYLVIVGAEKTPADLLIGKQCGAYDLPTPEWLPNSFSRKTAKILYSPSYNMEKVEAESVQTGNGINQFLADMSAAGYRKVVFLPGVYRISESTTVSLPDNMTVDLNGATLKMNRGANKKTIMVRIRNKYDTHLENGMIEGDYFEHDYIAAPKPEWVHGIGITGESKYCSFKNLVVRYITGYGVVNGFGGADFEGFSVLKFTPGTLDRTTGNAKAMEGLKISQMVPVGVLKKKFGYITASRCLGYQGMAMDEWNLMFHFFDKNKKYLETIDGEQYRRVLVPEKAEYVRVTVWAAGEITEKRFRLNFFKTPQNCSFENILIQNVRCVGMAPSAMYNHKIANCTFTRSGEQAARCAFDAEDGWDMMQDVWIYRNRFTGNPFNELLTCAGHNFVIEENEAKLSFWSRTNSYVIRNNKVKTAKFGYAGRTRTRLVRIEDNNTYRGQITYGEDRGGLEPVDLMKLYAAELAGNGKVMDGRWMLFARGNFSGGGIRTCTYGALYGSDLKKMPVNAQFNLLMSRLSDTTLNWLAKSNFANSIIENCIFTLGRDATKTIYGCKIRNTEIRLSGDSHLILENCTLENVTLQYGHWVHPGKITLKNCIVKNKDRALFRVPSYSLGTITIENSLIETGTAPAFNMYDTRPQKTDVHPGQLLCRHSELINTAGCIVTIRKKKPSEMSQKAITCNLDNVSFTGAAVDNPTPNWKTNTLPAAESPFKTVPRGCMPDLEQKIRNLIAEQK